MNFPSVISVAPDAILCMLHTKALLPLALTSKSLLNSVRYICGNKIESIFHYYLVNSKMILWATKMGAVLFKDNKILRYAALIGDLNLFQRAASGEFPNSNFFDKVVYYNTGKGGYLYLLRWLLSHTKNTDDGNDCEEEILVAAFHGAAATGQEHILRWAFDGGEIPDSQQKRLLQFQSIHYHAVLHGSLPIIEWLWSRQVPLNKYILCTAAATNGHLDVLKWLRSREPPCAWGTNTYGAAAAHGHVNVLEWLETETEAGRECPSRIEVCTEAARCGHLHVLQWWLVDTPSTRGFDNIAAMKSLLQKLDTTRTSLVMPPTPPVKQPLSSRPWNIKNTWFQAALNQHFSVLEWLFSLGPPFPYDEYFCARLAKAGDATVVPWLHGLNPPCSLGVRVCMDAAMVGNLPLLHWLRRECYPPCPWNSSVCLAAAANGQLSVLQWLRAQDPPCPWCIPAMRGAVDEAMYALSMSYGYYSCSNPQELKAVKDYLEIITESELTNTEELLETPRTP